MKREILILLTLLAIAAPCNAGGVTRFLAVLTGAQEVSPVVTDAFGVALLELNDAQTILEYSISISGLDLDGAQTPLDDQDNVSGLHFHDAPPGVNGGIVFGMIAPAHDADLVVDAANGLVTGVWDEKDDAGNQALTGMIDELFAGELYLNVHTPAHTGGEIRGQIYPLVFMDGFESGDTAAWSSTVP